MLSQRVALLLQDLLFKLVQVLNLIIAQRKAVKRVLILQLELPLQLLLIHLVCVQLHDLSLAEVDHVRVQRVDQHLVVDVKRALRYREKRVLTDKVLEPVVAVALRCTVIEGVSVGEERT